MKKNILFLIDGLAGGGAEQVVLRLSAAMSRAGHEVTIASLRREQAYPIPKSVRLLLVEDSYRGPFRRQTEIIRRARALDRALLQFFGDQKIDLAVSHLPKTDRIVAKSHFLKDAWFCLHCALTAGELDNKTGLRRWLKKRQLINTYSNRKLITVSKGLQKDVFSVGIRPRQITTIYNPIDLEAVRNKAVEPCRLEGQRFLLHVGRFNQQKRHDRLLEAFKISNYPGKLVLLGTGTPQQQASIEEQAYQLGITDCLIFEGFVINPYPYMRSSEALLLSSDYEGLPNVLVEALVCGTQVISTNCPYGPEEILRGDLARGLSECNAPALATALNNILTVPVAIDDNLLAPFTLKESVHSYLRL